MREYDPIAANINLAAQLVAYHGHSLDEIAEITGVLEHLKEVEAEVAVLREKLAKASTQRQLKFSTEEKQVRKLQGFAT